MSKGIVLGNAFVTRLAPVEDILDNVENKLHFAADTGLAFFEFLFFLPSQAIAMIKLESSTLEIDAVVALDAIRYVAFQIAIAGICVNNGIIRADQIRRYLYFGGIGRRGTLWPAKLVPSKKKYVSKPRVVA